MIVRFGRPVPELCIISNTVMSYVYDVHGQKLCQWNRDILNPHYFDTYTDAISNKGATLQNFFGFIDGIVRPICRQELKLLHASSVSRPAFWFSLPLESCPLATMKYSVKIARSLFKRIYNNGLVISAQRSIQKCEQTKEWSFLPQITEPFHCGVAFPFCFVVVVLLSQAQSKPNSSLPAF